MDKFTRYVVGYLFNDQGTEVALILKNHPEAQAGLYNGIGGHVEEHEDPSMAMAREFWEETSIKPIVLWHKAVYIRNPRWCVYYFWARSTAVLEWLRAKTDWPTDEEVQVFAVKALPQNLYSHVAWTVFACLAADYGLRLPLSVNDDRGKVDV